MNGKKAKLIRKLAKALDYDNWEKLNKVLKRKYKRTGGV